MQKFAHLLKKRLHQNKLAAASQASSIVHFVNQILHQKLKTDSSQVQALTCKEGILKIQTCSSVWNQELWYFQDELLEEIKKKFGHDAVRQIITLGV